MSTVSVRALDFSAAKGAASSLFSLYFHHLITLVYDNFVPLYATTLCNCSLLNTSIMSIERQEYKPDK